MWDLCFVTQPVRTAQSYKAVLSFLRNSPDFLHTWGNVCVLAGAEPLTASDGFNPWLWLKEHSSTVTDFMFCYIIFRSSRGGIVSPPKCIMSHFNMHTQHRHTETLTVPQQRKSKNNTCNFKFPEMNHSSTFLLLFFPSDTLSFFFSPVDKKTRWQTYSCPCDETRTCWKCGRTAYGMNSILSFLSSDPYQLSLWGARDRLWHLLGWCAIWYDYKHKQARGSSENALTETETSFYLSSRWTLIDESSDKCLCLFWGSSIDVCEHKTLPLRQNWNCYHLHWWAFYFHLKDIHNPLQVMPLKYTDWPTNFAKSDVQTSRKFR